MTKPLAIGLSESEQNKFDRFRANHSNCYLGSVTGGKFNLNCTLTGVGVIFMTRCNVCHKSKDITNYNDW